MQNIQKILKFNFKNCIKNMVKKTDFCTKECTKKTETRKQKNP